MSPGELLEARAKEAASAAQLAGLQEESLQLQVEVGSLQRRLQQSQDECASAKVCAVHLHELLALCPDVICMEDCVMQHRTLISPS